MQGSQEENIIVPVQSYYKWQVAFSYGITIETLIVWMEPFRDELKALGYKENCKILSPAIVKCIFDKVGSPSIKPVKRKVK